MQALIYSDEVIESMVDAMCGTRASVEDRDIYRQALRGLVRLGQAEQLLSMQLDFDKLTHPPGFCLLAICGEKFRSPCYRRRRASASCTQRADCACTAWKPARNAPSMFSRASSKNRICRGAMPISRATCRNASTSGLRLPMEEETNIRSKCDSMPAQDCCQCR